jgi:predicted DCC family thiol-disulfide oxidoreductase YuxK
MDCLWRSWGRPRVMGAMLKQALTDPDQRQGPGDVVIYDGECNFCCSQVQRLAAWDSARRLSFLSLHDPRVAERYPQLTPEQLMEQMWVIPESGEAVGGAAAVAYLSRRLPRLYLISPVLNCPGTLPLWSWLYRWVANRRYRIAGRNCAGGSCRLHIRS